MKKTYIFNLLLLVCVAFIALSAINSAASSPCGDNAAVPPFLAAGADPNLLLMIDNSASMYDPAYVDDNCYDDTFSAANVYGGYFVRTDWYYYNFTIGQFEKSATAPASNSVWTGAAGTAYNNTDAYIKLDTTQDPNVVTAFFGKGNFLNWVTASKFDIQKKILTGGKYQQTGTYGAPNGRLVSENRGCLDKRQIKEVEMTSGGTTYHLSLGVRPPKDSEKDWYTSHATQIDIFRVTEDGFDMSACELAIEEMKKEEGASLGTLKGYIDDCMNYAA